MRNRLLVLSTIFVTLVTVAWLLYWKGVWAPAGLRHDGAIWHGHELLLGWLPALGLGLFAGELGWIAVGPWALARLLAPFCAPPCYLFTLFDLSWWLALAKWRGRYLLLPLFVGNVIVHLDWLGIWPGAARYGLALAQDSLVLWLSVIAARDIPRLAAQALPGYETRPSRALDWAAVGATALYLPCDVVAPFSDLTTSVAAVACAAHFGRFYRWRRPGVWEKRELWPLFAGYAWIAAGFGIRVYANLAAFPIGVASHAFSSGALAVWGYGWLARSLGCEKSSDLHFGFWLLNLATLLRVWVPLFWTGDYDTLVAVSSGLWIVAFGMALRQQLKSAS